MNGRYTLFKVYQSTERYQLNLVKFIFNKGKTSNIKKCLAKVDLQMLRHCFKEQTVIGFENLSSKIQMCSYTVTI